MTGFPVFFLLAMWETTTPPTPATIQTLLTSGFVLFCFRSPQSQRAEEDQAHGGVSMEVWSLVTNL